MATKSTASHSVRSARLSKRSLSNFDCIIEQKHFSSIMENAQHRETPRYMEIGPNGEVLRQAPTVPPEIASTYLSPREPTSYSPTNSTYSPMSVPNYSYSNVNGHRQWWQTTGVYNPYRTTYQDYGGAKNRTPMFPTPTAHYMVRPGQYM